MAATWTESGDVADLKLAEMKDLVKIYEEHVEPQAEKTWAVIRGRSSLSLATTQQVWGFLSTGVLCANRQAQTHPERLS